MPPNLRTPLHVLLVEQDHAILDLFATFLRGHGHIVSAVTCAVDAVRHACARMPDAVFAALVFPDLDGVALCRRLRALAGGGRGLIVARTGYAESGARARAAGFDDDLRKPVSVHTVRSLLARHEARLLPDGVCGAPGVRGGRQPRFD